MISETWCFNTFWCWWIWYFWRYDGLMNLIFALDYDWWIFDLLMNQPAPDAWKFPFSIFGFYFWSCLFPWMLWNDAMMILSSMTLPWMLMTWLMFFVFFPLIYPLIWWSDLQFCFEFDLIDLIWKVMSDEPCCCFMMTSLPPCLETDCPYFENPLTLFDFSVDHCPIRNDFQLREVCYEPCSPDLVYTWMSFPCLFPSSDLWSVLLSPRHFPFDFLCFPLCLFSFPIFSWLFLFASLDISLMSCSIHPHRMSCWHPALPALLASCSCSLCLYSFLFPCHFIVLCFSHYLYSPFSANMHLLFLENKAHLFFAFLCLCFSCSASSLAQLIASILTD